MTKQLTEYTCDLSGAQTNHPAERQPVGWIRVAVTVGDAPEDGGKAKAEPRDICPFCVEALGAIAASSERRRGGNGVRP